MSRYMQIRLHLEPIYRSNLQAHFPRLAGALEELGVAADERRMTLYHLIQELERALYWEIHPALKGVLERHMPTLKMLQKEVEEKLAGWKLEGLDELLYRIEDAFQDLEEDLS